MNNSGKLNFKFIAPLIVFVLIAVFLGIGLTLNPKHLPSTKINKPAPSFQLALLSDSNTVFSPDDMKGQRWILNVWASWCVACRVEHPLLNEIATKTTIKLIGLNYKDEPEKAEQWLNVRGNPYYKIPVDITGDAGIDWGVYGVPETFVIDENGIIIYKHTGPVNATIVNTEILPLFSNKPSETAQGVKNGD